MKVTNTIGPKADNISTDASKDLKKSKAENSSPATIGEKASSAELNISNAAKSRIEAFNKIKELAMQSPDVREEKVNRLRQMIDNGDYKVDPRSVGDRMVDDHAVDAVLEADE